MVCYCEKVLEKTDMLGLQTNNQMSYKIFKLLSISITIRPGNKGDKQRSSGVHIKQLQMWYATVKKANKKPTCLGESGREKIPLRCNHFNQDG